ncbi:MAG: flippase [Chloroflexota bacterium]|nr:flippase [Chloroflexota bacterium]MDQ5865347.1 flippase [Chloroflexota bacterium]
MLEQQAPSPDGQPLGTQQAALGTPSAGTNNARRVALNAFNPFAAQLFTKLLMMGYSMVQYRLFADDQAALDGYILAAVVFSYTSTISEWGMGTLVPRDVARSRGTDIETEVASTLFGRSLALRLLISLGLFLPVAALIAVYTAFFNLRADGAWAVAVLSLSLLPSAFSGSVTALLYAYERMSLPAGIGIATSVLNVALGVTALAMGMGVVGLAMSALVTTLLTAVVFLWVLRRNFPGVAVRLGRPSLRADEARSLLSAGMPLMLNALLIGLFFRVDTFIIKAAPGGEGDLTRYNAAYSFLSFVLLISPAVTLALFPRMARHAITDRARLNTEYAFALKMLLAISVPIVAGTVWLAPLLIAVLTLDAPNYLPDSAVALRILIFFLPLSFINGLTQYVLIAVDRQRLITRAFGLTVLFNLVANLLLIPPLGIYGAALTTILSEVVLMLPFLAWTRREVGEVPLLSISAKPALAGAALGLLVWLLWPVQEGWRNGWGTFALYVGIGLAIPVVYLAVLLVSRPFTGPEAQMLKNVLRRS